MKTLAQLVQEYGYALLTDEEYKLVQTRTLNWASLEGELVRRKMLRSYPAFVQGVNFGYKMTCYHYAMTASVQKAYERGPNPGKAYGLMLLSAPPQSGKSISVTETFLAWALINDPDKATILSAYEGGVAEKFSRRNRDKFAQYATILSNNNVKLNDKIQNMSHWEVVSRDKATQEWYSARGCVHAAGIMGAVTSNTANIAIIDDPFSNMKNATSETLIEDAHEAYASTFETRLLANPGAFCILTCTPWVENDMIGHLRKTRREYVIADLNFQALTDEAHAGNKDPLGRGANEGLCPELNLGTDWALSVKAGYENAGRGHVFRAMYQGNPSKETGNLFSVDNWESYDPSDFDEKAANGHYDRVILSIDATFKDTDRADYVAMELWGLHKGNMYLRYCVRKHLDFPDTLDKIIELCHRFKYIDEILIESAANGAGLAAVIRKWRKKLGITVSGGAKGGAQGFPSVQEVVPSRGKYLRAQTAAPFQREGRCFIPAEARASMLSCEDDFSCEDLRSYVDAFVQEFATFPYGANDDLVDAYSQLVIEKMGLLTGQEAPPKREQMYTRYTEWWPEMVADFASLRRQEDRDAFIRTHGANRAWLRRGIV